MKSEEIRQNPMESIKSDKLDEIVRVPTEMAKSVRMKAQWITVVPLVWESLLNCAVNFINVKESPVPFEHKLWKKHQDQFLFECLKTNKNMLKSIEDHGNKQDDQDKRTNKRTKHNEVRPTRLPIRN